MNLTRPLTVIAMLHLGSAVLGQQGPAELKQRIPDGKPLLAEQVADLTGSGMRQEGRLHQVITYSDYRAVR